MKVWHATLGFFVFVYLIWWWSVRYTSKKHMFTKLAGSGQHTSGKAVSMVQKFLNRFDGVNVSGNAKQVAHTNARPVQDDNTWFQASEDDGDVYLDVQIGGCNGATGRLVFRLDNDRVPRTSANFREFCRGWRGLRYAGSKMHRIIPGFMAQGGDLNPNGSVSIYGPTFADEKLDRVHDKPYLLSMANRGPNTNGSQFFITFAPAPWLDGKHVVFGELVSGHELMKVVERAGTKSGRPKGQVQIIGSGVL